MLTPLALIFFFFFFFFFFFKCVQTGPDDLGGTSRQIVQVCSEEVVSLSKGMRFDAIVEVHVTGAGHDRSSLGSAGKPVGLFAELPGMGLLTRDEQHRTRRDRLDVANG